MSQTVPVYFSDDENELLRRIDAAKKQMHISRAGWLKLAAEEKISRDKLQEIRLIENALKEK